MKFTRSELLRAGAAGAVAVGAGGPLTRAAFGAASVEQLTRGGTLALAMISGGQTETVRPGAAAQISDICRVSTLFDGLYRLGPDAVARPWLAESAESNNDATVWRFRLRDSVTWHDGKALTADDVVDAIRGWADDKINYYASFPKRVIDLRGVRTRGKLVVEIPLQLGVAQFPDMTAAYYYLIVRRDTKFGGSGRLAVGTGPFVYETFTPGKSSVFRANKDWWGQKGGPYVARLIVDSSYTDEGARVNALLSGAADIVPVMPFALAKASVSNPSVVIQTANGPNPYHFACRVDIAPFKDRRVMQALKFLVDREAMVRAVFAGYADKGNDVLGRGMEFWPNLPVRPYDPGRAKALLKQAGYDGLQLTLNTSSYAAGMIEAATLYAQQAQAGGVKLTVKKIDPSVYYTYSGGWLKRPMMAGIVGAGSSVPCLSGYQFTNLMSGSAAGETHWGNPKHDAAALAVMRELNKAKARAKWRALLEEQYQAGGYIVYANPYAVDGYSKNVKGLKTTKAGTLDDNKLFLAWKSA